MEEKETIGAEPQPTPEQWAEKLRQLETQSHDQVRIIEHLEEKLKQERNKVIDECIAKLSSTTQARRLLESLKTP